MSAMVYLIRHASPDWERHDLDYYVPPGPPLTETGVQEAAALGAFLKQAGVTSLFSSPLERCLQTTQIASQVTGAVFQVLEGLQEWQPGEQKCGVQERMLASLEIALQAGGQGRSVAMVTHGGPIAALLLALGMDEATLERHRVYDHRNPLPTAGAWLATRDGEDQSWNLKLIYPRPD
ncbi:MAG: putative phosphoglycerate mutase [Chloroflexi bacterium]|nr:putative phosphoglycerate mutase [Chloroflexota bacterium]